MVQRIGYQKVIEARRQGVSVLEVLPASEYKQLHIAGALSFPLKKLDRELAGRLDPAQPVIVYCWDAY